MTGYGKGVNKRFSVEARSTNHRALDIQINTPPYLYSYHERIRQKVQEMFQRGRIEVIVTERNIEHKRQMINRTLLKEYYKEIQSLKDELSIPGSVDIAMLLSIPGVFSSEGAGYNIKDLDSALDSSLQELLNSRRDEGGKLIHDIKKRIRLLRRYTGIIEKRRKVFIRNAMKEMRKRLAELVKDLPVDESRLVQEVAVLINRSDFTEEIVRIKSHLKGMEELTMTDDAIGKKMDFFAQELRREINTIGAKASDAGISHYVIEMKHETEKIREQIHNLQ